MHYAFLPVGNSYTYVYKTKKQYRLLYVQDFCDSTLLKLFFLQIVPGKSMYIRLQDYLLEIEYFVYNHDWIFVILPCLNIHVQKKEELKIAQYPKHLHSIS
jgi:hypothetical protein